MFSRFQSIMNEMHTNKEQLPYNDHERALKLLLAQDWRVLEVKGLATIVSPNYDTLTVDELFSNLKSTKIDYYTHAKIENPGAPTTMALATGCGPSNPSLTLFVFPLCCLLQRRRLSFLGMSSWCLLLVSLHDFTSIASIISVVETRRGASTMKSLTTSSPIVLR